ncbi:MAG TPA: hypothetical protein VHB02_09405 [Acidimicrobiales bacterium]|nr:hypothetical protein [Acidimicrobiales bacterium]
MARTNSGKWVARAAATGGGRTYRGQRPVNWYAALVIIVVLGVASVVFANYEYRHPAAAANKVQPTKGTTWYAGLAFYVCGAQLPSVPSNAASTTSKQSFYTTGDGVITVAPKTTAVAGDNAVLGKFVSGYPGMAIGTTAIKVPSATTATTTTTTTTAAKGKSSTKSTTYKNGDTCPAGTPDAGKKGKVQVVYWANALAAKGKAVTVQGDPSELKFTQNQLITVGFVPAGTTLPKPNGTVVKALLGATTGTATTTTTAPTASSTTTTTASATTTTAAGTTTTTTAAGTTTTTSTTAAKPSQ